MIDPKVIYQAHLDAVSETLWREDYAHVAEMMAYPNSIQTNDAVVEIRTPEQMVDSLREFRASLLRLGATAYHRTCASADFVSPGRDVIEGAHLTYALRGGTYAIEPMHSNMTLKHDGKNWLGAGIRTKVHNRDCTIFRFPEETCSSPAKSNGL